VDDDGIHAKEAAVVAAAVPALEAAASAVLALEAAAAAVPA